VTEINREQQAALGRMIVEGLRKHDPAIVEGCLKRGADPNVQVAENDDSSARRPLLHWSAANFDAQTAQLLLDYGADIEARNAGGETALIFAIRKSAGDAAEFLMKHGADPLAQDSNGVVALDQARKLPSEYSYQARTREQIIRALTADYNASAAPAPEPPQGESQPEGSPEVLQKDLPIGKPMDLRPRHPPGKGLNL
jgi:ankyrin repeat protein